MSELRRLTAVRALFGAVLGLLVISAAAAGPVVVDQAASGVAMLARAGSGTAEKAYGGGQPQQASSSERDRFSEKKPTKEPMPPPLKQPADFAGEGGTSPTGPRVSAPAEMRTIPQLPVQLSSTALWDLDAEDDRWPEIGAIVREVVEGAGLALRQIRYRPEREPEPLVSRMPTARSLLVVGSYREFSDAEAQAVGNHVRTGGALLAIANVSVRYQRRMPPFNRILAEFGLAARMTRPGGAAEVADQPLTKLVRLQRLPAGLSIWGFDDWELINVGNEAVASAQLSQNGRILVLDGGMLVAADRRVAGEFKQLLGNAVLWLIGKE